MTAAKIQHINRAFFFLFSHLSLSLSTSRRIDLRGGEYCSRMRSNPRKDGSLHAQETKERERERERKRKRKKGVEKEDKTNAP